MKNPLPTRVNYFDKQFLRRNEFADEQSYQIDLRRRHNITHHNWGIVAGLEIAVEEGKIVVRPGLAIDGYGRELLLTVASGIGEEQFGRLGSNRLDVWLFYENVENARPPSGYVSCDSREDNTYRTSERPRIFVERASASRVNARRPRGVPPALLDAATQLRTTDDPLSVWPVYLGRVTRVPEEPDPEKQYTVDASDRLYAGVVAEVVDNPGNGNRLMLGPIRDGDKRQVGDTEYNYATGVRRAFAVYVTPEDSVDATRVALDARFAIDTDDKNFLRGTTILKGHLQMVGGAVQFTEPMPPAELVEMTQSIDNPMIYRVARREPQATEASADELCIDLGPAAKAEARKLVIGFTAADGTFRPTVTLEYRPANGAADPHPLMTIEGDLTLKGSVKCEDLIRRSLSQETLNALLASFQAGSIAAGGQ